MRRTNLTELEFMVLNALVVEGRTHPYALGRAVEERAGRRVMSLGALYKALHRLEEAGYTESAWEDIDPAEAKRPRRRNYKITGLGERTLSEQARMRAALYPATAGVLAWER
jgi:PadR family transcriptional regulator PadR